METGKKNWMQIATLLLCAVLVVLNVKQSQRVSRLETDLAAARQDLRRQIDMLENSVANRVSAALEEAEKLVEDWEVRPLAPDAENHTIQSRVEVRLKEWTEHTAVTLVLTDGVEKELPLAADGGGLFSGTVTLPETMDSTLRMGVIIREGEKTRREDLGAWSELSMLLPVRLAGWGGEQARYTGGSLTIGHLHFSVEDKDYRQTELTDTEFRIYRNGEVVLTRPAPAGSQTGGGPSGWHYETAEKMTVSGCRDGDALRLTAVGVDAHGLGYEFTLYEWTVTDGQLAEKDRTTAPTLFWK